MKAFFYKFTGTLWLMGCYGLLTHAQEAKEPILNILNEFRDKNENLNEEVEENIGDSISGIVSRYSNNHDTVKAKDTKDAHVVEWEFKEIGLNNGIRLSLQDIRKSHYIPLYKKSVFPGRSYIYLKIKSTEEALKVKKLNIELNGESIDSVTKIKGKNEYELKVPLTEKILSKNKDAIHFRVYTQDSLHENKRNHLISNWTWMVMPESMVHLEYKYEVKSVNANNFLTLAMGEKKVQILVPKNMDNIESKTAVWLYAFLNFLNDFRSNVSIKEYENIEESIRNQNSVFSYVIKKRGTTFEAGIDIVYGKDSNESLNFGLVLSQSEKLPLDRIVKKYLTSTAKQIGLKLRPESTDDIPPYISVKDLYHDGLNFRFRGDELSTNIYTDIGALPFKPKQLEVQFSGVNTKLLKGQMPANVSVYFNERLMKSSILSKSEDLGQISFVVPKELVRRNNLMMLDISYQGENSRFSLSLSENTKIIGLGKQKVGLNFQDLPWNFQKELSFNFMEQKNNSRTVELYGKLLNTYWVSGRLLYFPDVPIVNSGKKDYLTILSDHQLKQLGMLKESGGVLSERMYSKKNASLQFINVDGEPYLIGRYKKSPVYLSWLLDELLKDNRVLGGYGTLAFLGDDGQVSFTEVPLPTFKLEDLKQPDVFEDCDSSNSQSVNACRLSH